MLRAFVRTLPMSAAAHAASGDRMVALIGLLAYPKAYRRLPNRVMAKA
jgi:hypothetical protein